MILEPAIEQLARPDMEALQLSRLQETVSRVYARVPFYRQAMDAAHVTPDQIRTLRDLERLPFTRKSDLRDHYPFGLLAVPLEDVQRFHASSGTKGKPTVVAYTRVDIRRWARIVARAVATAGGKPGDRFHNAYGYGLFTGGLGLHYGIEELGAAVIPVSGGNTPRQVQLIMDFRPRGISGTPSYVMNIVDEMTRMGLDARSTSLEYGILGAEPWSESLRQQIQEGLGIKAMDIYGLSEVIGPGVAIECIEAQNGLHIAEDHFLPEVINPTTGEPVPDGETGELVFTSLTKEAFPVLRYRTGDIASLDPEPCRCGRTLVRMSRVKGRLDDMLIIRGVNVFPTEVEYVLLQIPELAPHYQIEVNRVGVMDTLEVHCEVTSEYWTAVQSVQPEHPHIQALRQKIAHLLKSDLGISVGVRVHQPRSLARSEGKAVRIIDRRGEGS
ncbi:MAG: AMP-binding protein [Firmicutes bacterium]|nr:AMP-binding protein [Bacillota bacterium]